jgi:hypothetical protein
MVPRLISSVFPSQLFPIMLGLNNRRMVSIRLLLYDTENYLYSKNEETENNGDIVLRSSQHIATDVESRFHVLLLFFVWSDGPMPWLDFIKRVYGLAYAYVSNT